LEGRFIISVSVEKLAAGGLVEGGTLFSESPASRSTTSNGKENSTYKQ
jgi:hypothetical protein